MFGMPRTPLPPLSRPQLPYREVTHRLRAILAHTTKYAFDGASKLARDVGVTPSAISRILSGKRFPSFALMMKITEVLEKELGRPLDPRELMTISGNYPTESVCDLCGCRGCSYSNRAKSKKQKQGKNAQKLNRKKQSQSDPFFPEREWQ